MSLYDFDLKRIEDTINKLDAKLIGLQFPDGLKTHALNIANKLETELGITTIISGNNCFGACDGPDEKLSQLADLIIHFGHTSLQLDYNVPILFIETFSNIDLTDSISNSLEFLEEYKIISLATTSQHLHNIDQVKNFLEDKDKTVILHNGELTRPGQVLGCNFSSIKDLDVEAYLYIGSGNFHPLGIKLFTHKPVVIADPYMNEARLIDNFADRILRIRFAKITKANNAKNWGIIVSSKEGQHRISLAINIKEELESKGFCTKIIILENISPDHLLPFMDIDAFVLTACPRIAIDDSNMYTKPLLTPKELEIVLNKRKWEDYQLDEILFH